MPVPTKKIAMSTIMYSLYTYLGLKVIHDDTSDLFDFQYRTFNKNFDNLSPSIEKWFDSVALTLRDYLAIISWGEARHSHPKISYFFPEIPVTSTRQQSYKIGSLYNPKDFLPKLYHLFQDFEWGGSFGGKNWGRVVEAAMEYGKMESKVYIDHIMDIAHNGGTCFNKGVLIKLDVIPIPILEHKAFHFIWEGSSEHPFFHIELHPYVFELFQTAHKLKLLSKEDRPRFSYLNDKKITPPKINWKSLTLRSMPTDLGHPTELYSKNSVKYHIDKLKEELMSKKGVKTKHVKKKEEKNKKEKAEIKIPSPIKFTIPIERKK